MDEDRLKIRSQIHKIMWSSKAGCVGLDEKTCIDLVWRLCGVLDDKDEFIGERGEYKVRAAKAEIPEPFRRSFIKALIEAEAKAAWKEIFIAGPLVLVLPAIFYFTHTEAGKSMLPRPPSGWVTSKWMVGIIIVGCLMCIGDIIDKSLKIKNTSRRARELEKLLL